MNRVCAKVEDGYTYPLLARAASEEFPHTGRVYGIDNSMNTNPREGWICQQCVDLESKWVVLNDKTKWRIPNHMRIDTEQAEQAKH
jgi:hypothetical protein